MFFSARSRRGRDDSGYALLSVVGMGTAIMLTVGVVGGYAIQTMNSAGRTQGFNASVQAAQAGVDDFIARLRDNSGYGTAPNTAWQPVAGSVDGDGNACVGTDATLPPNCPRFRHSAVTTATGYTVTSVGKSRGEERAVQVTLKKRALTDYLYFSDTEAADPADGFAYPSLFGGAPPGCGERAWGSPARPPSGCVIPTWRGGDSTEGSRVHTDDVFSVVGNPTFDSRVSAAIPACATDASACVLGDGPGTTYKEGPAYADDLEMPGAEGLDAVRAAAQLVGGCTYYGPTRIRFLDGADAGKMRVWSPQTRPQDNPGRTCGGGVAPTLLDDLVAVPVAGNVGLLGSLGLDVCLVYLLSDCISLRTTVNVTLDVAITNNLLAGTGLLNVIKGLIAPDPVPVPIPANGAIYVQDNKPAPQDAVPDPTLIQCLVGSGLGMYSSPDTNLTAGLLNSTGTIGSNCTKGRLFVDGVLDGVVTAGVSGDIVIMSDLRYRTGEAGGDNDRLGLVATGPIEVYNPLQCTLAAATCLSPDQELDEALDGLSDFLSGSGDLANVLQAVPGYGDPIRIDASILSLGGRFGLQLPVLTLGVNASVLNGLINLDIDPPALTVNGSIAQRYRGIIAGDLVSAAASAGGSIPRLNLNPSISSYLDVDFGFDANYAYDGKLRTSPPPYLPAPASTIWDPQTFAEVAVS